MSAAPPPYNFDRFERAHLLEDVERTLQGAGVAPGEVAPDFTLPDVGGAPFQLRAHRDRPLLLRFASYTSPFTIGSVEPLKRLHRDVGDEVRFVDVLIRQGHPGPDAPPYHRNEQKRFDALRFARDEALPWPVLVDDLDGRVHTAYGRLPDASYLIGVDGRVAFASCWTHVPTLRDAITTLLAQDGRGVVGEQRLPHPLAPLTDGWRAIERGLPQSVADLDAAAPGVSAVLRAGRLAKPLIGPLTLTSRRWSRPQLGLALIAVGVAAAGLWWSRSPRRIEA